MSDLLEREQSAEELVYSERAWEIRTANLDLQRFDVPEVVAVIDEAHATQDVIQNQITQDFVPTNNDLDLSAIRRSVEEFAVSHQPVNPVYIAPDGSKLSLN